MSSFSNTEPAFQTGDMIEQHIDDRSYGFYRREFLNPDYYFGLGEFVASSPLDETELSRRMSVSLEQDNIELVSLAVAYSPRRYIINARVRE